MDGHLEILSQGIAAGWVWSPSHPEHAVVVTARIAGVTLFTVRANNYRADLAHFHKRGGQCGFTAPLLPDAVLEIQRKLAREGGDKPPLNIFVHPVSDSKVRAAQLWRRLSYDQYQQILSGPEDGASLLSGEPNLYIGLIRRADPKAIAGWCASAYPHETRSRLPVALYVDGLWADTTLATAPLLSKPVGARLSNGPRGLAPVALRFRFNTPAWMRDGREHQVAVALAGRSEWLIDEPRTVCFDDEAAADGFAMPALHPANGGLSSVADGPTRGEYEMWIRAERARKQRAADVPAISVLVETTRGTDQAAIDETLASLRARSVRPAEIVLFGPTAGEEHVTLRRALESVTAEHIAVCRAGDRVAACALEILGAAARDNPDAAIIYGDDDLRDLTGRRRQPRFKTAYCPDRTLTDTLFEGLTLVRAQAAHEALSSSPAPIDARTLFVKVARRVPAEAIVHTPDVLCHRRGERDRLPSGLSEMQAAFLTMLLEEEAKANGRDAPTVLPGEAPRVVWPRPQRAPLVSAIIPTRDGAHMFEPLVNELLQDARRSDVPLEIVLMDNDSRNTATHAAFARMREAGVRVVPYPQVFNYSAICNAGAAVATGDVFLFMNDDLIGLSKGLIEEVMRHVLRPDVGAVGARLSYPDGTNQHCGVGLGIGGVASHLLKGHGHLGRADYGRFRHVQTVSAVTAALLGVTRSNFNAVGGFDTSLSVAYNDVDFCLRLSQRLGLRVIYTPHARAYHLESQTRGLDVTAEKRARLAWEKAFMRARWGSLLDRDPYVSPNHSRTSRDLRLALPVRKTQQPVVVAAE